MYQLKSKYAKGTVGVIN